MSKQTTDALSIVALMLGSMLMLAAGFGVTSSNNVLLAGVVCFIVSVSITRILKKTRGPLRKE